mgnify:CR=1 FL=1
MAAYFALRIMERKLTFSRVIGVYPQYKDDIIAILTAEGKEYLIEE